MTGAEQAPRSTWWVQMGVRASSRFSAITPWSADETMSAFRVTATPTTPVSVWSCHSTVPLWGSRA